MHIAYEALGRKQVDLKVRSRSLEAACTLRVACAWSGLHIESGVAPTHVERGRPLRAYIGAHLLEVIFTSVGVFRYFRVAIGTCSSLPVMSALVLSFQVAPSEKVTRRFMLHR